jgi:hypothetical protein
VLGPIELTDAAAAAAAAGPGEEQQQSEDDKKKDKDSDDQGVEASLRLINTGPINLDRPIDEPVTSGSDIDLMNGPLGPN